MVEVGVEDRKHPRRHSASDGHLVEVHFDRDSSDLRNAIVTALSAVQAAGGTPMRKGVPAYASKYVAGPVVDSPLAVPRGAGIRRSATIRAEVPWVWGRRGRSGGGFAVETAAVAGSGAACSEEVDWERRR
ncbi:MAG: hypothetical protein ACYDH5_14665 [Acidimicrobiales bacterium]